MYINGDCPNESIKMSLKRKGEFEDDAVLKHKTEAPNSKRITGRNYNREILERALTAREMMNSNPVVIDPHVESEQKCSYIDNCNCKKLRVCVGCKHIVCEFHSGHDFLTDDPDDTGMNFRCIDFDGIICEKCDRFIYHHLYLFPESDDEGDDEEEEGDETE